MAMIMALAGNRGRTLVLGTLALTALALAGIAGGPWWRLSVENKQATFSGTDASGGLALLLPLAAGAGVLLLLALGGRGRQVTGVLLGLLGLVMTGLGFATPKPTQIAIEARLQTMSLANEWTLHRTALPVLYALVALLFLAAAVALIMVAPRWPDRSARYRRVARLAQDDPEGWWRDLDAGRDPTVSTGPVGGPGPVGGAASDSTKRDPDFRDGDSAGHNDGAYRGGQR